jgi:hypothetical protein
MSDVVVPKNYSWDMCEDHISNKEREILIQAKKEIVEGKVFLLNRLRK